MEMEYSEEEVNIDSAEYGDGYEWTLKKPSIYKTNVIGYEVFTDYVSLTRNGHLYLSKGYATDGITGITGWPWEKIFARKWLRNNCFPHDGLYQLMRLNLIPRSLKFMADMNLRDGCIKDGAYIWQADIVHEFVTRWGSVEQEEKDVHPVYKVP